MFYVVYFFFKQKTAYEWRISDWSSDVCSSDLLEQQQRAEKQRGDQRRRHADHVPVRLVSEHEHGSQPFNDTREWIQHEPRPVFFRHRRQGIRHGRQVQRSEERRVGEESVSKGRYRWSPYPSKKKN